MIRAASAALLGGFAGLALSVFGVSFFPLSAWHHTGTGLLIDALVGGCAFGGAIFGACLHGLEVQHQDEALRTGPVPGKRGEAPRSMT